MSHPSRKRRIETRRDDPEAWDGVQTPVSPIAAIPEPGSLALLALGVGVLMRRRKRAA